jgi:deoxyribodipyrimidine photo-lyase
VSRSGARDRAASTVVWFRRDLRVHDHPALAWAADRGAVIPLFVLDPVLLGGRFASPNRAWFLLGALDALDSALAERGVRLVVKVGRPEDVVPAVAHEAGATTVAVSRDYTPYGRARDRTVAESLSPRGVTFEARPGVLVHDPEEVLRGDGGSFSVFTPFLRRWETTALREIVPPPASLEPGTDVRAAGTGALTGGGIRERREVAALELPAPTAEVAAMPVPGEPAARERLDRWLTAGPDHGPTAYASTRDRPADPGATSGLGPDLRFGLLSPVEVAARALVAGGGDAGSRAFVRQLAWRDFYAHVLWHQPRVARAAFQRRFASVRWLGGSLGVDRQVDPPRHVDAWRAGRTGYPIVDAAMRQLAATGRMPNRARMIVASFLTKDLLVDWRVGEAHFMRHLLDGDPASNLGGWQWAASVGTDPQPYFRIFNPVTQGERFDPDGSYVRTWIPELARVPTARVHAPWTMTEDEQAVAGCRIGTDYPAPIVDHAAARARALAWFDAVRSDSARQAETGSVGQAPALVRAEIHARERVVGEEQVAVEVDPVGE